MKLHSYNCDQFSNCSKNFSLTDYLNFTIKNRFYTVLKLGTPVQKIKTWIDSNESGFYLLKNTCILNDSDFNENNSVTFHPDGYNAYGDCFTYYHLEGHAYNANDTFYLNNDIKDINKEITVNEITFAFIYEQIKSTFPLNINFHEYTGKSCASIGFRARYTGDIYENNNKNFLEMLKKRNIIDSYLVFIKYDDVGNEDYLFFGEYPENIYSEKYKTENSRKTQMKIYDGFEKKFGIEFDKIQSGNYIFNESKVDFNYNLGVIIGTNEYKKYIEENYFKEYLQNNTCEIKNMSNYIFYVCDKSKLKEKDIQKFPSLYMTQKTLNETFIINYRDLFLKKGDHTYFMVVFNSNGKDDKWTLGKIFLSKYDFVYNFDSKLIIYYVNNKEIINFDFNDIIKYIGLFFVLCIIFAFTCFLLSKAIFNKRKKTKKADELDEDYIFENPDTDADTDTDKALLGKI